MPSTLLHRVHGLIDRTYDHGTADVDPATFVIGDAGLATRHGRPVPDAARERSPEGARPTARLLVRTVGCEVRAAIYYPDELIARLERADPCRGLSGDNVRELATFVEELDHLLLVLVRARGGRTVSGLELEMHANVTKVHVTSLFLARTLGVARLGPSDRQALRHELLGRGDYDAEPPDLRHRYREARLHAVRLLERLEREPRAGRPSFLRRFSRVSLAEKIALAA